MLSKMSVRKPYTVLACVVIVIVLGVVSLTQMTTDLLPDMSFPYTVIITTDPGASPEEVETQVTAPIESVVATTSNIQNFSSMSYNSYSVVVAEYSQNANMDSVIIEIQQELNQIKGSLPDEAGSPIIMQIDPDMLPVMIAAVDMEEMDLVQVSDFVTGELLPRLESIEGVASASASGGIVESVQVTLNEDKIKALNDTLYEKIQEQFLEAQEQLDSAREELENGKAQLEDGQNQLANGVAAGENELTNQRYNLYQSEAQLSQQKAQLTTMTTLLPQVIDTLQKIYERSQEIQQQVGVNETLLDAAQPGLDGVTEEKIRGEIAAWQEELEQQNQALLQLQEWLTQIGVSADGYQDIPAAINTLSGMLTDAAAGLAAIETAQQQLQTGKIALDQASAVLSQNQILASIQLSGALAELNSGAAALEEAQQTLDTSKEEALAAVDLHSILSLDTVKGLLTAQNFEMPAGYLTEEDGQYLVRVGEKVSSYQELRELVLMDMHMDGVEPIRLSDVADISQVDNSAQVYAKINGNPGILLSFEKQTGYSTGDVTDALLERFDQLEKENQGLRITTLMDQGIYIDMIVDSVIQNMVFGAVLAILILILFLRDWRPTLMIACAIPLSVIFAIVLMYFSGVTLNVISMSGLALGIGMLVDNSIVVIENIYRMRKEGLSLKKAAVEGASQVTGAIIASTLTTVCVFAPIIFTEGITRQLFVDMGLTIAYTLLASLIVALTLVPAMAAGMLRKKEKKQGAAFEGVQAWYGRVLSRALKRRGLVLIFVAVLLVASIFLALSRGTAFMPEMSSPQLSVTLTAKEEEQLDFDQLTVISDEAVARMLTVDGVDTVGAMAGGGTMSIMSGGSTSSISMYVLLEEGTKRTNGQITRDILAACEDLDCQLEISGSSMDMSAMTGEGISVQIKGRDLDTMQQIAQDVAALVESVEGTARVDDGRGETTSQFTIVVDKEKAAGYDMTVAQVFQLVMAELADTSKAATLSTDAKDYSIYVASGEQQTVTRDDLESLTFSYTDRATGETTEIPLREVAEFENSQGLSIIQRDAQNRYLTVTAQIRDGYNVGLVGNAVQSALDSYECPEGYIIQMTGENENINEAMEQVLLMLVLAVVLIYLIMVAQFQSLLSPFIIMFTIPLAFTGGFLALFLTGSEVSVIALVGFVMLSGIIVNNGIVLVDYINQLRKEGMSKRDAIVESGKTRLRPVLMTALTTIISMSTMALGLGGSGAEMMQPMAIVTVGGLIYGTLLTLLVVPCIYDLFHKEKSMVEEEL